jgi:pilus assembly protein CpaC
MKRTSVIASLLVASGLALAPGFAAAQGRGGGSPSDKAELPQDGQTITLAVGETHVVSARDIKNYSEGVAGVIDVKLTTDAGAFVLNGRHQGSTTLLLIRNDGTQLTLNIDVFARSPQVVERELSQLLSGLPNVQIRRVGAHIVIDGTVNDDAEKARVTHVASLYPGQVDSLVVVATTERPATPGAEPQHYLVRIDFYFVQYDSSATYAFGLGWPGAIGANAVFSGTLGFNLLTGLPNGATATASLASQPLPRLDIASTTGWARVLRQATVIANNGTEATFSNGGEQNFPVTAGLAVGLQKIPFGADINMVPKYNPTTREIEIKLTAEVADLTAPVAGTILPGRTTAKVVSNVSLKLGQSLILSGLRRESTNHAITGIPILKDIPVLGILFGSHTDDSERTEAAVFMVPSIIQPISTPAQELVERALAKFHDYHGDIDHVQTYDRRPPVPKN